MKTLPNYRRLLFGALATAMIALGLSSSALGAEGFGELARFRGKGTAASPAGGEFELGGSETHAFTVDPVSGSIYAGDEKEENSEELRIQKYTAAGAFEAAATIKVPKKLPAGLQGLEGYDGFAISQKEGRIYVLSVYHRFAEDTIDAGAPAAGALYAYSTTPSSGKLVPASGTGKEGLLGTVESLGANSETQGKALLDPSGLAVDPVSGNVLILGLTDEGAGGLHPAIAHVSPSSGEVLSTYVDPEEATKQNEPDSPVVSQKGKLFMERGDELLELPAEASSGSPVVVYQFAQGGLAAGPFAGELVLFGEGETADGGGLSIVEEGGEDEGRIVAFAEIHAASEAGALGELRNGALDLKYLEEGEQVKVSELGWTGGVPGEGEEEASEHKESVKPCEIGFAGENPIVGAATGQKMYVFSPAWSEVIEFGPGGGGCPPAKAAPSGLEVTISGKPVANPEITNTVTLSADVVQANVLKVTWKFGDGKEETVATPAGEQIQRAETSHKFAKAGKLAVEAIIQTDDLATPQIIVKGTVNVVENVKGAPKITGNPIAQSVIEGETVTFKASASGEPTPKVQWETSADGGEKWTAVSGGTSDTLTLSEVKASASGSLYRATFENGVGSPATSGDALLSVESKAAHEAKEKREKEEAAETLKREQEAAAAQLAAEQAASAARAREEAEALAAQQVLGSKTQLAAHEGTPLATIASSALTVSSSGSTTVSVSCPAGVSICSGTVTLRTASAVSASAKKAVLTLASASFAISGGQRKTITLHLSSAGRKLLARLHLVRANAVVLAHDPSGTSATSEASLVLRPARAAKHH